MSELNSEQRATGLVGGVTLAGWIVGTASIVGSAWCFLAQQLVASGVFMLAAGLTFGLLANALMRH